MIGFKKQFIFLHPPRTGGTSVENYLRDYTEFPDQITRQGNLRHFPMHMYSEIFGKSIKDFYKFSIVRNPWDRMVSYYFHLFGEYREEAFDQMLMLAGKKGKLQQGGFPREGTPYFDFTSCTQWLNEDIRYEGRVEHIRFENLQEDFENVCGILDIVKRKLDWTNRTIGVDREHYSKYYNEKRADVIAEVYADDIESFNYKYETV